MESSSWWSIHPHVVHHGEFFVYVLILLLLLYRPPVTSSRILQIVRGFVDAHFGDSIGLWLLHLSLALILVSDVWSNLQHVRDAANALFTASIAILKLTKTGPAFGPNGEPLPMPPPSSSAPPPTPAPTAAPGGSTTGAQALPAGWKAPAAPSKAEASIDAS